MNRFVALFSLLAACATEAPDGTLSPETDPETEAGEGTPGDGAGGTGDGAGGTGDGSDGSDGTGDGGTGDQPVPLDSDWQILDQYLSEDGCNMADWIDSRDEGTLQLRGDGEAFTITHNRGAETCALTDDETYRCDQRLDEDTTVSEDFGLDALLLLTLNAEGDLVGDDLVMETRISADCQGGDCWLVEVMTGSMPCDSVLMVEAERLQ